jgi:serine/threonine protein kinase
MTSRKIAKANLNSRSISLSKRLRAMRGARRPYRMALPAGLDACPGYTLRESRGRGGFGEVWEGVGERGERVALKFMRCDGAAAPREIRKLQLIRQLVHPHLIQIQKVFCHGGYLVLVMELAEGSLQDWLEVYQVEEQALPRPIRVCKYLGQVAEVLDFLNTRQHRIDGQLVAFRHCDVKPSNMLSFNGSIKLADFGVAVMTASGSQRHPQCGTTTYAAPEIFTGTVTDRSDQYSLAISYVQLRTGKLPFPDPPPQFRFDYVRPAPDLAQLTPRERPIVARALAPLSLDRWPSCVEMMSQLTKAVAP